MRRNVIILDLNFTDVQVQVSDYIVRYSELQARVKAELSGQDTSVQRTFVDLFRRLPKMSEEYCHKYVFDLCDRTWPPTRFEDISSDVNDFCESCFDYKLLEFVIDNCNCSTALKNDVQEYSKEIGEFKCCVTVSNLLQLKRVFLGTESLPKSCKKLKICYNIDPERTTLDYIDRFREEIWRYPKLTKCAFHVCSMTRATVQFAISEKYCYSLLEFVCSKYGEDFLQQHQICKILIEDMVLNKSVSVYR